MPPLFFRNGVLILGDRLLPGGAVEVRAGRIHAVRPADVPPPSDAEIVDLGGDYLAPGFVDLHVHGGGGADFMDGTDAAFRTACLAHLRHGTTSLLPTTTVARHQHHLAFLNCCRRTRDDGTGGARVEASGGLAGLAERVRTVDGRLQVSSPACGPTVVTVELPSHA